MQIIAETPIILASGSPRRKELLSMLGVPFDVVTSDVEEHEKEEGVRPIAYAKSLAVEKAKAVAIHHPEAAVIGADTIVVHGTRIFPKPKDEQEAKEFLQMLSGRTHSVITAVSVLIKDQVYAFAKETKVTFYDLDDDLIDMYIASGDSLDKAGAYGIQSGGGALFVKGIEGDYYAVMGLPIAALYKHLRSLGILSLKGGA